MVCDMRASRSFPSRDAGRGPAELSLSARRRPLNHSIQGFSQGKGRRVRCGRPQPRPERLHPKAIERSAFAASARWAPGKGRRGPRAWTSMRHDVERTRARSLLRRPWTGHRAEQGVGSEVNVPALRAVTPRPDACAPGSGRRCLANALSYLGFPTHLEDSNSRTAIGEESTRLTCITMWVMIR